LSIISIVDDDASFRTAVSRLLKMLGHIVHAFESAEELLASAYLTDISCVISDVQMPVMSGIELLMTMRIRGHAAPVIFITASPDESVHARALNAGAICFLAKPFEARELIACLNVALRPPE
jgi:FixJ family two-component response regulator